MVRSYLQVSLLDAYETDKTCLLKFDTLPGTDILTYLGEKGSYSEQMLSEITRQVLDALDYVQWRGKVYLNLEPGNIIVCSGRSLGKTVQVKLANFETTQTVEKDGTPIKGTYNFDYAGNLLFTKAQKSLRQGHESLSRNFRIFKTAQLGSGRKSNESFGNAIHHSTRFLRKA